MKREKKSPLPPLPRRLLPFLVQSVEEEEEEENPRSFGGWEGAGREARQGKETISRGGLMD